MLERQITYTDYNDQERTETFRFNLTKTEITEMQLSSVGGLNELIQRIIESDNQPEIIKVFKEVILKAYGEKSLDGKHFEKSEALSKAFSETPAYDILFMELATDSKKGAAFINGIVPKALAEEMEKVETAGTAPSTISVVSQ